MKHMGKRHARTTGDFANATRLNTKDTNAKSDKPRWLGNLKIYA